MTTAPTTAGIGQSPPSDARATPPSVVSQPLAGAGDTTSDQGEHGALLTQHQARDYSWPPFEVGNFVPIQHGARSPRVVHSLSKAVADALVEVEPWLASPRHALALSQLAGAEAIRLLLLMRIERLTTEGGDDQLNPRLIESVTAAERAAAKLADGMGLTPLGRARLAAISTSAEIGQATLADLAAQGRAIVEQHGGVDA